MSSPFLLWARLNEVIDYTLWLAIACQLYRGAPSSGTSFWRFITVYITIFFVKPLLWILLIQPYKEWCTFVMNADSTNWFCFSQILLWQSHRLFRKLLKNLRSFHKHMLLAVLKEFLFWYFLFNDFLFKLLEFVNFCSPIQDFLLPLIFFWNIFLPTALFTLLQQGNPSHPFQNHLCCLQLTSFQLFLIPPPYHPLFLTKLLFIYLTQDSKTSSALPFLTEFEEAPVTTNKIVLGHFTHPL